MAYRSLGWLGWARVNLEALEGGVRSTEFRRGRLERGTTQQGIVVQEGRAQGSAVKRKMRGSTTRARLVAPESGMPCDTGTGYMVWNGVRKGSRELSSINDGFDPRPTWRPSVAKQPTNAANSGI